MSSSTWVIGIKFANGDSRVNGLPCVIGRSPAKELLKGKDSTWSAVSVDHKYLSRLHTEISVECGGDDDATPPEDAPDCSQIPTLHIKQFGKNPTFFGDSATTVSQGASQSFLLMSETGTRIFFPAELQLPEFNVKPSHKKPAPEVSKPQSFSLVMSAPDAADDEVVSTDPPASHKFALLEKAMSVMGNAPPAPQLPRPEASVTPVVTPSSIASPQPPPVSTATDFLIGKGWGALSAPTPAVVTQASTPTPVSSAVAPVITPVHNVSPTPKAATHQPVATVGSPKMGFWEWKSHIDGDDAVPTSWKRYIKAQADVLEAAFRDNGGSNPTVNLDATYAVCFDDKEHGMVQYRRDDPSRWRPIRRRGGDQIQRPNRKRIECIPQDGGAVQPKKKKKRRDGSDSDSWDGEDSYEDDSWIVDSDSDESYSVSDSSSDASLASESSSDPGEKRRRKAKKLAKKHK